jgi:peptidoglycan/xylan/chitin deacetylase (PgdA/CDA1 family)
MKGLILPLLLVALAAAGRTPVHYTETDPTYHVVTQFQTNMSVIAGTGTSTTGSVTYTGAQSNQITFGTAASTYQQTLPARISLCRDSFVSVFYHVASKSRTTNIGTMVLILGKNTSNFKAYEFGSANVKDTGQTRAGFWSRWNGTLRKFSTTGTYNCDTVNIAGLQATAASGQDTVTLGAVYTYAPKSDTATLILTVDDGFLRFFQNLYSTLKAFGMPFTAFLNCGTLGTAPFASATYIDSIYRDGLMGIESHWYTHDTLPLLSVDSCMRSLQRNATCLAGYGWGTPSITATPYGAITRAEDSALRLSGVDFNRSIASNTEGEPQMTANHYSMKIHLFFNNTLTLTQAKARLDSGIAAKTTMMGLIHDICVGCAGSLTSTTWDKDTTIAFLNYVHTQVLAGRLKVKRLEDNLNKTGGALTYRRREG